MARRRWRRHRGEAGRRRCRRSRDAARSGFRLPCQQRTPRRRRWPRRDSRRPQWFHEYEMRDGAVKIRRCTPGATRPRVRQGGTDDQANTRDDGDDVPAIGQGGEAYDKYEHGGGYDDPYEAPDALRLRALSAGTSTSRTPRRSFPATSPQSWRRSVGSRSCVRRPTSQRSQRSDVRRAALSWAGATGATPSDTTQRSCCIAALACSRGRSLSSVR